MAKLLLNLRNVPDDEADEVRAMLDRYPTSARGIFVAKAREGKIER